MTRRDDATELQVQAARPDASTWLAANAGSGKTRVLTDRVARLLLEGVDPQRILCLTYTKAAASEMQNRLFKSLGQWAMLRDDPLRRALDKLGASGSLEPQNLAHARTLFARAIETPGGLKIQTIHSFCATLLRRFPLEAGVSPQFREMEDRAATLLRRQIVDDMAAGHDVGSVDGLAAYLSEDGLDDLTASLARHREDFAHERDWPDIADAFGLPADYDDTALLSEAFQASDRDLFKEIVPVLRTGGKTDAKNADSLAGIDSFDLTALAVLERVFLTGASAKSPFSAKIGSVPSKALQNGALSHRMPEIDALMARVETARDRRCRLAAARKAFGLHAFAARFLPEYAHRKKQRGWLDFDDLILKARRLLTDPAVAAWVLYRLDGGIDHILIDEAQDTSPEQWDVIEKLTQEFTGGAGAPSGVERTIFVVGDKKQSIYSFQGADPEASDRMQADFAQRLSDIGSDLRSLSMGFSFRSSSAILALVDAVFADRTAAGFAKGARHRAFKTALPGRVDLWPPVPPRLEDDENPWFAPVDLRAKTNEAKVLAYRIADAIKRMIETGEQIPVDESEPGTVRWRSVTAGDVLILVRRRSDLFAEIIRACKATGLPIAGADRLKLAAELAVKDLGALMSFLATPEDDLSLAAALKSPIFGWDEAALFRLAHGRRVCYLWPALRAARDRHPETLAILDDLMGQTDFLRPYDLIERILTRHGGRAALLARLGPEAEDGIDALLSQALAYERTDIPSLTGFLHWMETDEVEIKRQLGTAKGQVRVMTVHGSKGLESPIVILPDTGRWPRRPGGPISMRDDVPVWRVATGDMPEPMTAAQEAERDRQDHERLRLLYVALTRAEKWLIVAAAGELGRTGDTWHDRVRGGMEQLTTNIHSFPTGEGLRFEHGDWTGLARSPTSATEDTPSTLPDLFQRPASPVAAAAPILSPSDLGGAKALPGDSGLGDEAAKRRGTAIHTLLERLPAVDPADWPQMADLLLGDLDADARRDTLREAQTVLTAPDSIHIFSGDALVEVPFTAEIANRRIHGAIDRLLVAPEHVLAIDFKSNAAVPTRAEDVPEGLLRQMGAYASALGQIYPDRRIETAILWTRSATLMPLAQELVMGALHRALCLDGETRRS